MILPRLEELEQLVRDEIIERKQAGYDTAAVEAEFARMEEKSVPALERLFGDLERCPMQDDYPYQEPSDLDQIKASWPGPSGDAPLTLSEAELYDKIYGGWLGRCAGCMLGKPVEFLKKDQIESWLRFADAYPLTNYFPPLPDLPEDTPDWLVERLSLIENWTKKRRAHEDWKPSTLLGRITCMARDDDIDYTIMRLDVVEDFGLGFTTMDIGESLLYQVPYRRIWSAERATYRNLINGILPPKSATYMNPYREIVGATTRGDMWGYLAPGMPALAAELAHRDARLTHTKNGIYGEMFASAVISTAFVTNDISEIVEAGVSVVPKNSRLAETLTDVISWSSEYSNWEDAWGRIIQKYGHYHRAHTINNIALILLGVIYGEGDFGRSVAITVMSGLDTDSTGATVGSLLGVITGAGALADKWVKPLNDRIESFVVGYNDSRISDLAKRTLTQTKGVLEA